MLKHLANYISDYLNMEPEHNYACEVPPTANHIAQAIKNYESVHDKTVTVTNCQTDETVETDETDETVETDETGGQVYEYDLLNHPIQEAHDE